MLPYFPFIMGIIGVIMALLRYQNNDVILIFNNGGRSLHQNLVVMILFMTLTECFSDIKYKMV